jgi:hypothetical protein
MRRMLVGTLMLGLLVLAWAQAASAAGFVAQPTPTPRVASGTLSAVSCSGSSACLAVGYGVNSLYQQQVMAESWNGTSWKLANPLRPSTAQRSYLNGVACPSATSCEVVGTYSTTPQGGQLPLAEHWNGSSWTVQPISLPSGANVGYLSAVSCVSATSCVAVGASQTGNTGSNTLAEYYDGTKWFLLKSANGAGASASILNAVSCVGSSCVAVGDFGTGDGYPTHMLAEKLVSGAFVSQAIPTPSGATAAQMEGVSCVSATSCEATGGDSTTNAFSDTTVAEHYNGTTWTIQSTPALPSDNSRMILGHVSCASATSCTAVSAPVYFAFATAPLVEHYNGSAWTVQPAPVPSGSYFPIRVFAWLYGVSCSASGCTTVGGAADQGANGGVSIALAEHQAPSSTSWTLQAAVNTAGSATGILRATTCLAGPACVTVGNYASPGTFLPLTERYTGSSWTALTTPTPAGGGDLYGVACTSSTACVAIGQTVVSPITFFSEQLSGSTWTIKPVPLPSGTPTGNFSPGDLTGVACTSATFCIVVGDAGTQQASRVQLAERWNGTSWSLMTYPQTYGHLKGVECTSTVSCIAVGDTTTTQGAQPHASVARFNGSTWTVQNAPTPAGTQYSSLASMSCSSASACTAVGGYSTDNPYYADDNLALRYNGKTWSVQAPLPGGYGLGGVSCGSAIACQAVGGGAQGWNGTSWSGESVPASDYPGAVGCAAATVCEAVGPADDIFVDTLEFYADVTLANLAARPQAAGYSPSANPVPANAVAPQVRAVRADS